jgi:hypothetical protein
MWQKVTKSIHGKGREDSVLWDKMFLNSGMLLAPESIFKDTEYGIRSRIKDERLKLLNANAFIS